MNGDITLQLQMYKSAGPSINVLSLLFTHFLLVSFTITCVDAAAHHVCFPLNQFVFDMHAQSLFSLTPP